MNLRLVRSRFEADQFNDVVVRLFAVIDVGFVLKVMPASAVLVMERL